MLRKENTLMSSRHTLGKILTIVMVNCIYIYAQRSHSKYCHNDLKEREEI